MHRKTFLEINVNNLVHNYELFKTITNKKMIAVVKANGYGTIDYKIAEILEKEGVDFFAVATLEEALKLRKHNIKSNILIMGYVDELDEVKKNDLSVIIPSYDYIENNKDKLKGVKVHIKINTGLNRLGVRPEEAKKTFDALLNSGAIIEGAMTHFAVASDIDYTYSQYYIFKDTIKSLNYDFKYIHTSATDAALYLDDDFSNYIRVGLGLFGYANIEHTLDLKPVISLKAEIICSKKVMPGEGVSYGHHFISDGTGYILTAAIGYADGVSLKLENKKVYVGDEECTVVGTVCMDLIMIKSNKPHKVGEFVEVIGDHISVEDRKIDYDTTCCKVITDIQDRVTRVYIKDNRVIDEIEQRN